MRHYLFALTTLVLAVSGISMAGAEENKPANQEKYEYPQEVTKTFMKGCGFSDDSHP